MSQQRPFRASKVRAAKNIATMTSPPPPNPSKGSEELKKTLTIPRDIWNDYQPQSPHDSRAGASQAAPEPAPEPAEEPTEEPTEESAEEQDHASQPSEDEHQPATSRTPRACNVKTTRFQYGGPDARIKGQDANTITLEQPCLRPTCTSCLKWHAHLMTGELGGLERSMDFVELRVDDGVSKDGGFEGKRCDSVIGSPERMDVLPQLRRPVSLVFRSTKGRRSFKALACELAKRRWAGAGRKPRRRYRLRLVFESRRGRGEYKRVVRDVRSRRADVKST
jgi:hypothetical protein